MTEFVSQRQPVRSQNVCDAAADQDAPCAWFGANMRYWPEQPIELSEPAAERALH